MYIPQLIPNWRNSVRETFTFRTEIETSENGIEQRWALSVFGRRGINFVALVDGAEFPQLIERIAVKFGNLVEVADPVPSVACIIDDSPAGSTELILNRPVEPGTYAVVGSGLLFNVTITGTTEGGAFSNAYDESYDTVGSSNGTIIAQLEDPLPRDVYANSSLHLIRQWYLGQSVNYQAVLSNLFEPTIDLLQNPEATDPLPCYFPTANGDGKFVLNVEPDWSRPIPKTINTPYDTVDYGGTIKNFRKFLHPIYAQALSWNSGEMDLINNLRGLFSQMKGRRGSFWCPSFTCDFKAKSGMTAGSSTITIEANPYLTSGQVPSFGVLFQMHDGRKFFRKITAVSGGGTTDGAYSNAYNEAYDVEETSGNPYLTLTFDDPAPFNFSAYDVSKMSITRLSRFSTDNLTVDWVTSEAARILFNVQSCSD